MPGFYNKTLSDRLEAIIVQSGLSQEEAAAFSTNGLNPDGADHMIENVV
jgi:hydroxymethylglutaryl-CoA reductase